MASCVGLDIQGDFEQLIDILAAYADRRHDEEGALKCLQGTTEKISTMEQHTFEWDVALLARALYGLWTLDKEGPEACKKLVDSFKLPDALEPEDPNMAALLALIAKDDAERVKECLTIALSGCNIIFRRRLASLK